VILAAFRYQGAGSSTGAVLLRFTGNLLLCLVFAFTIVADAAGQARAGGAKGLENSVKAAYLYKFLAYADWPADRLAPDNPFLIGVSGSEDMEAELLRVTSGRLAAGRRVLVKPVKEGEPLSGLHLLYVAEGPVPPAAANMRGLLTVSDNQASLAASNSAINFRTIDGKVRFEVALPPADRSGLRLSSRLLSVASQVYSGAN
jgi:hypothetical protein